MTESDVRNIISKEREENAPGCFGAIFIMAMIPGTMWLGMHFFFTTLDRLDRLEEKSGIRRFSEDAPWKWFIKPKDRG